MRSIPKIMIAIGVLVALGVVGKAFFYAPTGEAKEDDSGLRVASSTPREKEEVYTPLAKVPDHLPARLIIPKLNIDTDVQHRGITYAGNMSAPSNYSDVSWYKYGTIPGEKGSAVMAGHEDNAFALDGVFKHLDQLEPGDAIYVANGDGTRLHFEVVESDVYPYDNSPLEKIFNRSDTTRLNLITCAGDWIPEKKTNDQRLVVYTKLVNYQ